MARRIRPLNGLERILGRLEEVSDDFETDLEAEFPDSGLLLSGIPVDVIEREEEILVKADVPGFEKDDLRIQANADEVSVFAEFDDEEDDEDDENYFRRERPQRSLSRTVKLPTRVESEEATAAYEDGVLRIRLPKAGSHDGDQIEIE